MNDMICRTLEEVRARMSLFPEGIRIYLNTPWECSLRKEDLPQNYRYYITPHDGEEFRLCVLPGHYTIAIDGPSGSGKSTIAKALAECLGLDYLDTGAMYRALTYALLRDGVNLSEEKAVVRYLDKFELSIRDHAYYVGEEPVNEQIRSKKVTDRVSEVAAYAEVRNYMVQRQRAIAQEQSAILDGRDIGTVVLKDAPLKIFLTADVDTRARRRYEQMEGRIPLETVKEDLIRRDHYDMTREVTPLIQAPDAVKIDNSEKTKEQTVKMILQELFGGGHDVPIF